MKNMDPLNDNVVALLQTSNDQFTREIWKDGKTTITDPLADALYSAVTPATVWGMRPCLILQNLTIRPDYSELEWN